MRKGILGASLVVALVGLADAAYLGVTALAGVAPTCNLLHGCDIVAQSPYSRIMGIPLGVWGTLFYTTVVGFLAWGLIDRTAPVTRYLIPLTAVGFALSLYFTYLQAFVILAWCEYCVLSAITSTALFALSFCILKRTADAPTS